MNKIPVGKTIAYAYSFTLSNLGAIIGLVWLPMVILTVLKFLPYIGGNGFDAASQSQTASATALLENLATIFLTLVLYSIVYVAVIRQALGLRQGSATIHFALGQPEFRVLGAWLLVVLVIIGFLFVYTTAAILLSAMPPGTGRLVAGTFIAVVGVLAFIYILVRLSFLLVPVTVVEEKVSLSRNWTLTEGNFWGIVAIMLAITIPLMIIDMVGSLAIVGNDLIAQASNHSQTVLESFTQTMQIYQKHMPSLLGLDLVLAPFSIGLNMGAAAFAYRALVPTSGTSLAAHPA
jgi:hypothetical protein